MVSTIPYVLYVRSETRKSSKNHRKWTGMIADYITIKLGGVTSGFDTVGPPNQFWNQK